MSNYMFTIFVPRYHFVLQEEVKIELSVGQSLDEEDTSCEIDHEGSDDFKERAVYILGQSDHSILPEALGGQRWRVVEPIEVLDGAGNVTHRYYWNDTMGQGEHKEQEEKSEKLVVPTAEVHKIIHDTAAQRRFKLVNEPELKFNDKSIGMKEGKIGEDCIWASSYQEGFEPHQGVLDGPKCWKPLKTDGKPFLEVNTGRLNHVSKLHIQGSGANYCTKFLLHHSTDGANWFAKQNPLQLAEGTVKNGDTSESYFIHPPILAQYIRLYPLAWEGECCVRLEIDMNENDIPPVCFMPASAAPDGDDLRKAIGDKEPADCSILCFDVPMLVHNMLEELHNIDYWNVTRNDYDINALVMLTVAVPGRINQEIFEVLSDLKIGVEFGSTSVVSVQHRKEAGITKEMHNDIHLHRCAVITEFLVESIMDGGSITFDYIMYLTSAAVIAAVGLGVDSPVSVVASMLVSPIMGPVLCIAFGTVTRDWKMVELGLLNELFSMTFCFVVGFITGLLFVGMGQVDDYNWPTPQMAGRGTVRGLGESTWVAAASGIGVAIGVTSGGINGLVGVAISASLLPPVVNTGMFLGWMAAGDLSSKENEDYAIAALNSTILTIVNIILVALVAMILLKCKEVLPHDHSQKAFWTHIHDAKEGVKGRIEGVASYWKEKPASRSVPDEARRTSRTPVWSS